MFKVNNKDTRTTPNVSICLKLTIKSPERQRRSGVLVVKFELILTFGVVLVSSLLTLHLVLVFLLLTLSKQIPDGSTCIGI